MRRSAIGPGECTSGRFNVRRSRPLTLLTAVSKMRISRLCGTPRTSLIGGIFSEKGPCGHRARGQSCVEIVGN